ncbi:L-ribulose-5-phosphate 4-epimerase [Mesomycoplasma hyopneumoniae]|uniref:L-ribulose-5-phosphate 4-epimerase n=1 Tax=Mesomycoplasma hyopneumoniae (strain 232) TaxID=295358 RepID=Q600L6_MESH2|nr:L-ribulose-5-phosphate 4-epimerase [Mesomycoplasma hyopneumoniae]AAV27881.1 L-ribulose-phosphate 4-epimerase [Mesomycoplasma hyopneumoniae 232]OWG14033.1 L-ribulose-5-phosphate 4-epimerase [Mesomycoplasma hyopneumoniae]QBY87752.1 L-ribulose-5-phosphate 4-epimerase [Mesomycoplasma hyopneumoniae]VEU65413.1 L-ribulose-5-phosphate 4-epimerase [Mesomycoplasma hyopneumoniae]
MKIKDRNELEELQKAVLEANLLLYKSKLALHTWGNVSAISKDRSYYVIKPSGIPYEKMKFSDMVPVDLENNVLETNLNPSSDTPTHSLIYKADSRIQAIVHTHSPFAVAWAQAGKDIPALGTTHADNFYGSIPCTNSLSDQQIQGDYEHNTGLVILDHFQKNKLDYIGTPAVLVKEHGPFCWSNKSAEEAVKLAMTFEEVAKMAFYTKVINPYQNQANPILQKKHYERKHGKNAYYGQKK